MKTRFRFFLILTVLTVLLFDFGAKAQSGTLKGTVIDSITKEPISFASVIIEKNGKQIGGTVADFDGNFVIKPIPAGIYDIKAVFVGYHKVFIKNIEIKSDSISHFCFILNPSIIHVDYFPIIYPPLITIDPTPSGQTFTFEEIRRMPW